MESRDYIRQVLLDDLREGLITTREQLTERAKQWDLVRRLGYDSLELMTLFLDAIWEEYV